MNRVLVNIETGETRSVDHYAYWGEGLPDGWKDLDSISKEELVARIHELHQKTARNEWGW